MSEVSSEQFLQLSKMSPEERFDYSLKLLLEQQQLWGLFGEKGWLMLQAEQDTCLPVWPCSSFAVAWEQEDFPDCQPKAISLDDWVNIWLPGMQQNGTFVLNFPMGDEEEGIIVSAEEMLEAIDEQQNA